MDQKGSTKRRFKATPAVLMEQIFEHQRWVATDGVAGKQLVIDDLECWMLDLAGVNLSGAVLKGADFFCCDLSGVQFVGTDLEGAVISECQIRHATFAGANLRRGFLSGSNCGEADFQGADTEGVIWTSEEDIYPPGSERPDPPKP